MNTYVFEPIGCVRSCFKEKFGVPRQPGLVPEAKAVLEIFPPYRQAQAFRQLDNFSHIWILFVFHQCEGIPWKPMVRPPRLGGNRKVGVFASRSGFRPNPIGQSAVALDRIETIDDAIHLHVKGIDLVDGTPILDIKPYLPYADSLPYANSGYASERPAPQFEVLFADPAEQACRELEKTGHPQLKALITKVLALDPRPGYAEASQNRLHGMRLWDINIRFRIIGRRCLVESIEPFLVA